MAIKESLLRDWAKQPDSLTQRSMLLKAQKSVATTSVFLSHSHKDMELVTGLLNAITGTTGISLFVDWQSSSMPKVTGKDTASQIKKSIAELDLFIVLATQNAMSSRWVPWELGIADTLKGYDRIAIVPMVDPFGNFSGNEYCQLYRRLDVGVLSEPTREILAVFEPNQQSGIFAESWLAR